MRRVNGVLCDMRYLAVNSNALKSRLISVKLSVGLPLSMSILCQAYIRLSLTSCLSFI